MSTLKVRRRITALKPTATPSAKPPSTTEGAAASAGTKTPTAAGARSAVLMSIPPLRAAGDQVFSQPDLEFKTPASLPTGTASPKGSVVALCTHEASGLQVIVQGAKQRFVDLMGGSIFWRLFVGSGVAIFIGSATLLLLSPTADQLASNDTHGPVTDLAAGHQDAAATEQAAVAPVANSAVELTVSSSVTGDVPVPAEFDDPFKIENQVTPKAIPAVHFTDSQSDMEPSNIQPVSQQRITVDQPAWLAGTIDVEEDGESGQLKRKHERSRPSHR